MKQTRLDALRTPIAAGAPAWLWALPVFSCCMLGFVPPLVIATKMRTRQASLWAVGFTVTFLIGFMLIAVQPEDVENAWTNLGAALVVVSGVGGAAYSAVVGSRLDWGPQSAPASAAPAFTAVPLPDSNQGAIAGVLAVRQKRADARTLAQRDPHMARELRIGRPDLARS
jgi:hypothetical protein